MFLLLKDAPVINHPIFRIVLGAGLLALGLTVLHDNIVALAIGALLLVMGLARGTRALTARNKKGQLQ